MTPIAPQTLLIFDFDGTIANSLAVALDIANELAPEFGLPQTDAQRFRKLKSLSLQELLQEAGLAWHQLPRLAMRGRAAFKKRMNQVEPIAGMDVLLKTLSTDHRLGILTSNSKSTVEAFLKAHELEYFSFVDAPRNVLGKALAIRKILNREGFSADQAIMIGDEVRDIEAAQAAGIKAVAVTWGLNSATRLQEAKPDAQASTVAELQALLLSHIDS